jgi:hypothetical protein
MKGFGQMFDILLLAGIQIVAAEIDLRMDVVLESKIDSLKEHGIRDIDMNNGHG